MMLKGYKKLTILHTESSKGWGGQEIRILQEALGMRDRGYRVLIATEKDGILFQKALAKNLEVFPIHFSKYNPLSFLKIKSLIEKEKVDILNTHSSKDSWIATIAAKIAYNKPKIIRTRHLSTPIKNNFNKLIYYLADFIITTGQEIKNKMIERNKINPEKILSIPTGVDLKKFDPQRVVPAIKRQSDEIFIAMIGVLRSWKGHVYFLKAIPLVIKHVPQFRIKFFIVGDGPQKNNIIRCIEENNLNKNVSMLGHREDIPEILASMDFIVHPSYANEGIPQVVIQAMAMKKPVIGTDVGSLKEVIINEVTGFLIKPKNVEELSEKMILLCNNKKMLSFLGENAMKFIEKDYSSEKMFEKLENLYEKLSS